MTGADGEATPESAEMQAIRQITGVAATVGLRHVRPAEFVFEVARMLPGAMSAEASGWLAAHLLRQHNCCDEHLEKALASMRAELALDRQAQKDALQAAAAMADAAGLRPAARH